jgi:predicted permease
LTRLRGRAAFGQLVTGNYFEMLGVPPAFGRTLLPADAAAPGANAVMVLSHRAWRVIFGGDSSAIGSRVSVNGVTFTVVGVARDGFDGLGSVPYDFWVPITMIVAIGPTPALFTDRTVEGVFVIGRVQPGAAIDATQSRLADWMRVETNDRMPAERVAGVSLIERGTWTAITPDLILAYTPVAIAFFLVLLIACANVANMMLARGMVRQREIGIRLALGAGRRRLVRQLLTEAVLLAVPSGLLGFVISRAAIEMSVAAMYATIPEAFAKLLRVIPLDADVRVVVFMFLSAVIATVLFGLAPTLQATRPNIVQASRGDFDTQFRPSRLRNGLVIAQITLSVLLLICAGVLLSGARHTERLDPGIRIRDVVQIDVRPPSRDRVVAALRADPAVQSISASSSTPLDAIFSEMMLVAGNRPAEQTSYSAVSPEYFQVLDLSMLGGRRFTAEEAIARAPVAVVSRSTAQRFWPGRDPIGQTLSIAATDREFNRLEHYRTARVVGVTSDASPGWIGKSTSTPTVYYPLPVDEPSTRLIVRVRGDAETARAHLDRTLAAIDSGAVQDMHTLAASFALQVYPFQALFWIASALGAVALLLTLTGVYGVLSYLVAQRRKEFGIRLALGAGGAKITRLVLRQSLGLSAIGLGAGLALALIVSRLFAIVVVIFDTFDAAGYIGGTVIVLAVCVIAAYVPSRRAAMVNPVETLRADS